MSYESHDVLPPRMAEALPCTRRRFVEGLALTGLVAAVGLPRISPAQTVSENLQGVPELVGNVLDLVIGEQRVNFTGRLRTAITVNDSLPAPTLRFREGDKLILRVRNTLEEDTSIHWHGFILPANMDGVPGLSFHGIHPGETFTYEFPLKQSGTYWYHSHSAMQEARGLYGAIIVEPKTPESFHYDREHVVLLSDWSDTDPHRILLNLKKQSTYYNYHQRTVSDFFRDVKAKGFAAAWADRKMWGQTRMTPTDLADVSAAAYTYLVNGATPASNWTGLFKPGEKVRLRFINAAAMTYFDIRIPGLKMTVVAADGQNVQPVDVEEFRIGVAETLDVIVEPVEQAYTIFAQSADRTGYARATLATAAGMSAAIPALDPRPLLSMDDMGHDMSGDMAGMDHSMHGMEMQSHPASESNNSGVDMQAMMPMAKLDDPGVGLRDSDRPGVTRRVLTYADLKSAFPDPDGREPSRDIELHLTGHMERYVWSFDGIPFASAEPLKLKYGERVRLILVNDTMMEHPIHLHGMWSDLEDENGNFLVRKHTISMPPGTRRTYRVTADALGRWAYHCHLLMHMDSGMFREVRVDV
ncbi:MAG: copper resistance system multicopper oxidase [Pedobacter sp.]|nr:copper resistance system multicopper oxidase [Pedobacter sp.]